jgi:L-ascorbate metabolism protein UlaG (beta-lactamase superfamily)
MIRRIERLIVGLVCTFCLAGTPAQAADIPEKVTFEYIAHACFRITSPSGGKLLIDPFASRVWIGYDYADGIEADAVLITHPHYDHDGGVSVGHSAPWRDAMTVWREPGAYRLDDIEILGVAGKHADPYGKEFGQTNTIWVLEIAGLRIAHIGDNGPLSQQAAEQIGDVDIVFLPIDSDYHILKESEIQSILEQLTPGIVIPMHYRLADLEPEAGKPDGLGGIDAWLEGRGNVRRLATHETAISLQDLPDSRQILVFEHWPTLQQPQSE